MEKPRIEMAKEAIRKRTEKAQMLLRKKYDEMVAMRLESSKNGNGDADWGWSLLQEGEDPSVVRMAAVVLKNLEQVQRDDIMKTCSDCNILYMDDRCDRETRQYIANISPQDKETLRSILHSLNGITSPPVRTETLYEKGINLSGGFCRFCDRINGSSRRIRAQQRKERQYDCFGSCFDSCSQQECCDYQLWPKEQWTDPDKLALRIVPCVLSKEETSLDPKVLWDCWIDYWTWESRRSILAMDPKRPYKFRPYRELVDC